MAEKIITLSERDWYLCGVLERSLQLEKTAKQAMITLDKTIVFRLGEKGEKEVKHRADYQFIKIARAASFWAYRKLTRDEQIDENGNFKTVERPEMKKLAEDIIKKSK